MISWFIFFSPAPPLPADTTQGKKKATDICVLRVKNDLIRFFIYN